MRVGPLAVVVVCLVSCFPLSYRVSAGTLFQQLASYGGNIYPDIEGLKTLGKLLMNLRRQARCGYTCEEQAKDELTSKVDDLVKRFESFQASVTSKLETLEKKVVSAQSWTESTGEALKTKLESVNSSIASIQPGSVYTHWGSGNCTNASSQIYSGFMAGASHTKTGGGANILCLTSRPDYEAVPVNASRKAYIYGADFRTNIMQENYGLCAVCRVPHTNVLMVPGANKCPTGWADLYSGHIMTGNENITVSSEFICVDKKLQSKHIQFNHGQTLYLTFAVCGGLQCPPYRNNSALNCMVCYK